MGNPAYDALMMFKVLLLQVGPGLSDYYVEERITDSLLFSEYLLLDMESRAPDHSIICRFRTKLARLRIMDKLLREQNQPLFPLRIEIFLPPVSILFMGKWMQLVAAFSQLFSGKIWFVSRICSIFATANEKQTASRKQANPSEGGWGRKKDVSERLK